MIVGIPKEIKPQEARVGMTPAGVAALVHKGHEVLVEQQAGQHSGFLDEAYRAVGARLVPQAADVFASAEMIVKVKEPLAPEFTLIRPEQIVFTYFHLASDEGLTQAMQDTGATCIAYETVSRGGRLPLLTPMSEVAGRMATQQGAKFLEKPQGGKGKLLGGVPGVPPAVVLVLGGGVAGTEAAKMAAGMGASVYIFDTQLDRLRELDNFMPANVQTVFSTQSAIEALLPQADLIIGSVLIPGAQAPKLITKSMLSQMQPGTVLVDIAIDQGGCFETSVPTTHENPIRVIDGIVHYAVTNMPGAVPQTSTQALTNATLRDTLQIAELGWQKACRTDATLAKGVNIVAGSIVYPEIADCFNRDLTPIDHFL